MHGVQLLWQRSTVSPQSPCYGLAMWERNGDDQPDIALFSLQRFELTYFPHGQFLLAVFDPDFDSGGTGAQGIFVDREVDPTIAPRRCDKWHVIAYRHEQFCDQFLELVRPQTANILLDLGAGCASACS